MKNTFKSKIWSKILFTTMHDPPSRLIVYLFVEFKIMFWESAVLQSSIVSLRKNACFALTSLSTKPKCFLKGNEIE